MEWRKYFVLDEHYKNWFSTIRLAFTAGKDAGRLFLLGGDLDFEEDELSLGIQIPHVFTFYVSLGFGHNKLKSLFPKKYAIGGVISTDVNYLDGVLALDWFKHETYEVVSGKRYAVNIGDVLLGAPKMTTTFTSPPIKTILDFPEGTVPVSVIMHYRRWDRPRWFSTHAVDYEISSKDHPNWNPTIRDTTGKRVDDVLGDFAKSTKFNPFKE